MCSVLLKLTDVDTGGRLYLETGNLTVITDTLLVFSTALLTVNRHYNVSVWASNVLGHTTVDTTVSKFIVRSCAHM